MLTDRDVWHPRFGTRRYDDAGGAIVLIFNMRL